jgi:hypothetical protein
VVRFTTTAFADMGGGCATLRPMSQTDPWAALARATGAAGLAGIVLLFVPIIAITTLGEREFDATREEVAAFFRNMAESSWADVADTVVVFRLVALTWFRSASACCSAGPRAIRPGVPPWRSCSRHCSRLISSQTRACRPRATAPTSTRVSDNLGRPLLLECDVR